MVMDRLLQIYVHLFYRRDVDGNSFDVVFFEEAWLHSYQRPCKAYANCVSGEKGVLKCILRKTFHYLNHSLPWNQTSALGYLGEVATSTASGQGYLILNGSTMVLFISICLHHRTFYKMFHHIIQKLGQPDKVQSDHETLCHSIRFHLMVKEWL